MLMHACRSSGGSNNTNRKSDTTLYNAAQLSLEGKVTEHIVPHLPGFDLNPKDIRFLGTPIDLIAFKGLNNSMEEIEIVFIEVKTGGSTLSARERAVENAVEQPARDWRRARVWFAQQGRLVRYVGPVRQMLHFAKL